MTDPAVTDPATSDPGQADPASATPTPEAGAPRQAALPQPTISTGGSSTATPTSGLAGSGLTIDGSPAVAAYAIANYLVQTNAMHVDAEFTVSPAPNAAFEYLLTGTGGGYSSRQLRLERDPGSDQLKAAATTGVFPCGAIPSNHPTAITLSFDGASHTYDVLIDGQATACTNLPTRVSGPVVGFRLQDAANEGYGGHVEFSHLGLFY